MESQEFPTKFYDDDMNLGISKEALRELLNKSNMTIYVVVQSEHGNQT